MTWTADTDERHFATLLTKSASPTIAAMGAAVLAVPDVVKVGPHGYEHNWVFVGIPAGGTIVHHPEHGRGVVDHLDEHRHVHVDYQGGQRHKYEHQSGRSLGRLVERGFGGRTDAQLDDEFHRLSTAKRPNEAHLADVLAEMDRREQAARHPADRIDAMVARGMPYHEAWAEVHGVDPAELDRQARASLVDANRRAGETREQTARRLYAEHVHQQLVAAEQATRGHLLSPEGRARGVDPVTLFSGPASRARRYGSEDLHRHWAAHPRHTYTEFRAGLFGRKRDREAAAAGRLRGNGRDFGV